ncbi:MAG: DNA translocase FtsK [Chitinispirillaceae bacterium]|nr:DNA translocase FtsK [Chitinispirillaceae bacterium]
MARKKKTGKNEKNEKVKDKSSSDFGHEIWGLIYCAIGILMLISLISHFFNSSSNLLGTYFGTSFSLGLIWVFGVIPSFFFPLGVLSFGWLRLKGGALKIRSLFFWTVTTFELCVLLSVFHLPHIVENPGFAPIQNRLGFSIVESLFLPIFGVHQFGPYFITGAALLVTLLAFFRISPQIITRWISELVVILSNRFARMFESMKASWEEERRLREEAAARKREEQLLRRKEKENEKNQSREIQREENTAVVEKKPKKSKNVSDKEPIEKTSVTGPDDLLGIEASAAAVITNGPKNTPVIESMSEEESVEDEARKRLDEELAAFRAKKKEPIKIMTIETAEVEAEGTDVEDDEGEVDIDELPELSGRIPDHSDFEGVTATVPEQPPQKPYQLPDPSILPEPPPVSSMVDKEAIERNSMILEKTLMNFGVEGKVVFVSPGPVVTRYEIELAPGIKVSRVLNLHDDISMAVNGQRIRIEAPIPGKSAVGIELPNAERQVVHFKNILMSDIFKKSKAKLPIVVGTNISGAPYVTDIAKMPHVLIAGQTGSGKSVCINSLICSLLMTRSPEELRLIMIDPKKVELAFYERIPHLMSPVVTESKEAVKALQWGVVEMERRYRMLAKVGARNIDSFNSRLESGKLNGILSDQDNKPLPFIVIIVDELADLMMTASKDVEGLIQRIAQLARAVGIHLIVATQRPSVDIITGPIKANLTSRIGFRTIQSTDSRTILGHVGAEKLLGMGDMLFLRNGAPEIERFHGAFISEEDVEKIVEDIRKQDYHIEKIDSFMDEDNSEGDDDLFGGGGGDRDELFEEAARIIVSIGQGSTSLLQRRMKIGYARAGRLMDGLEKAGFVGPPDGSKAREVRVRPDELEEYLMSLR